MSTPEESRRIIEAAVAGGRESLTLVDPDRPADAIGHLQEAARNIEIALNESMAAGVVAGGLSVRQAAAASGLAPNTLPARLATTSLLAGYRSADRRVRSEGIARARYDLGQQNVAEPEDEPHEPAEPDEGDDD